MIESVKKDWIAALRSGEYLQGQSKLNSGGKFCCLGVLCELAAEAGIVKKTVKMSGATVYIAIDDDFDSSTEVLPFKVSEWAGLTDANPCVIYSSYEYEFQSLAQLNDNGESFYIIADLIEEHL
jgi:hypothetical protein